MILTTQIGQIAALAEEWGASHHPLDPLAEKATHKCRPVTATAATHILKSVLSTSASRAAVRSKSPSPQKKRLAFSDTCKPGQEPLHDTRSVLLLDQSDSDDMLHREPAATGLSGGNGGYEGRGHSDDDDVDERFMIAPYAQLGMQEECADDFHELDWQHDMSQDVPMRASVSAGMTARRPPLPSSSNNHALVQTGRSVYEPYVSDLRENHEYLIDSNAVSAPRMQPVLGHARSGYDALGLAEGGELAAHGQRGFARTRPARARDDSWDDRTRAEYEQVLQDIARESVRLGAKHADFKGSR
jgi:hypothetical protein